MFSVSIGVLEQGKPLIGVVYDPMRDHLFAGQRGYGAALNDEPLHISTTPNSRTHSSASTERAWRRNAVKRSPNSSASHRSVTQYA
jgi:fructose-1,6-bisphosphatase/inositol monophosphatase family enzyme